MSGASLHNDQPEQGRSGEITRVAPEWWTGEIQRYTQDEDGEVFHDCKVVLGLGEYADEGQPDVSITIDGFSPDAVEAVRRVVVAALHAWPEDEPIGDDR